MKKVAFFDLDKTIFNDHTFFLFVKHQVKSGKLQDATWLAIQQLLGKFTQNELSYAEAANQMLIVYSEALKGSEYGEILSDAVQFFEDNSTGFYRYFLDSYTELLETHDVYLVTTNTQFIAEAVVERFSLSGYISTTFGIDDGLFNGQIDSSLADGKEVVIEILERYGFDGSMAFGDSVNDIGMLELVEKAVCINPDKHLSQTAKEKGWTIVTDTTNNDFLLELVSRDSHRSPELR